MASDRAAGRVPMQGGSSGLPTSSIHQPITSIGIAAHCELGRTAEVLTAPQPGRRVRGEYRLARDVETPADPAGVGLVKTTRSGKRRVTPRNAAPIRC